VVGAQGVADTTWMYQGLQAYLSLPLCYVGVGN
jgi:hypothetical protein